MRHNHHKSQQYLLRHRLFDWLQKVGKKDKGLVQIRISVNDKTDKGDNCDEKTESSEQIKTSD